MAVLDSGSDTAAIISSSGRSATTINSIHCYESFRQEGRNRCSPPAPALSGFSYRTTLTDLLRRSARRLEYPIKNIAHALGEVATANGVEFVLGQFTCFLSAFVLAHRLLHPLSQRPSLASGHTGAAPSPFL